MGLEGLLAPSHILILLVIVVLVFGTKKLRGAGDDLGAAFRSFRKAMQNEDEPTSSAGRTDPPPLESTKDHTAANAQARQKGTETDKDA